MKLTKTRNRTIPLLPRHKIYLSAPVEDGKRLADLFNRVWKRIALRERRTILRHWKRASEARTGTLIVAAELASEWCDRTKDYLLRHGIVAQCRDYGRKVYFQTGCFGDRAAMIDEDVCYFIAHELAHVTWTARGEANHMEAAANPSPDIRSGEHDPVHEICESLADGLAADWGFFPPGASPNPGLQGRT